MFPGGPFSVSRLILTSILVDIICSELRKKVLSLFQFFLEEN